MQQHEALRHENGMLWQQIEISRRNQDALNNKLSQVITTFQHIANRLSTSRASKIVAPNTQQLIEYQDNVAEAEADSNTPRKRSRHVVFPSTFFCWSVPLRRVLTLTLTPSVERGASQLSCSCLILLCFAERILSAPAFLRLMQCSGKFLKYCATD